MDEEQCSGFGAGHHNGEDCQKLPAPIGEHPPAQPAVPTVKAGALEFLIALFVRGDLPLYVEFIGRPGQFPLNVRESDSDLSG